MEAKTQLYRETIETIEQELHEENQEYMSNVRRYLSLSSIFIDDDELLTEQVYNMYLDVLEGQRNGLTAQEFLGDKPKAMADELLKGLPPLSIKKVLNLCIRMGGVYVAIQLLVDFATKGQISLNLGNILGLLFIAVGLPILGFKMLKRFIYQPIKWKNWLASSFFILLNLASFAFNIWMIDHLTPIILPYFWSALLALAIVLVTGLYHKEILVRFVFLPVFTFYLCSGLVQIYVQTHGITGDFWKRWLPAGAALIGAVIFLLGTFVLISTKRRKIETRKK